MPFSSLFGRKGSRKNNTTKGKPLEGIKAREESSENTHKEEGVTQNSAHESGDLRELQETGVKTSQVTKNFEESSFPQAINAKETEHEIPLEKKIECDRDELCVCLKSQENSDKQNMHCAALQHENNDAVETKGSELGFNIPNSSSAHDIKISESENRGWISHQESEAEHCSKKEQENVIVQQNTTEEMHSNGDDSKFEKILDNHKGVIDSDVIMMCSEDYNGIEKVESCESSEPESDLLTAPRKDEANGYETKQSEIINPVCDVSPKCNDSEKPNEPFKDSSETNTYVLEAMANETKNHTGDIKNAEKESAVRKTEMDDKNGESVCPTAKVPLDDVAVDSSNGDENKPEINGCEVSEGENSRTENLCDIKHGSAETNEKQPNLTEETEPNTDFSDQNDDKAEDMDSHSAEKILHDAQSGSDSAEVQIKPEDVLEEADGATSSKLNNRSEEHSTESSPRDPEDVVPPVQNEVNSSAMSNADSLEQKTESREGCITDEKQAANIQVNTEDSNLRTQINPALMNSEDHNSCEHSGDPVKLVACPAVPLNDISHCISAENDDFLTVLNKATIIEQHLVPSWKVGNLQVKLPAKSRGRGKLKVWKQRWVVFQMDEFVKDAKDPSLMINIYASECSTARSHSPLFWCTVSASKTVLYRSQSRTHKYAFSISVDGDVILHLAADSETASQEWMAAIRNLLWPQNQVLQLEKMLHGCEFEVSVIDNDFSFHAGLLGSYGNMKVNSNKLIFRHPQTEHVIQEWYLNTLDKFQLLPQNKEEDAYKVVVMHTGQDSSTGSGQIILFCPDAVAMLQSIASTIHKFLQYRTTVGKEQNQQELADLAEWLNPVMSCPPKGELTEEYYKVPRRQIRSLLDIPNFAFEKPLAFEDHPQVHEDTSRKSVLMTSSTSLSTFSQDSGISLATQSDDYLNCSVTSFTIGGRPVRSHTSSESSDTYSPPCTPEIQRKQNQEPEET